MTPRSPAIPLALLVALLGAALVPHTFFYGDTDWEKVYIPASERLIAGADIFQESFVYPPFAAVLGVPSVGLSKLGVRWVFWGMNLLGASLLMLCGWSLAGGQFQLRPPLRELLIAGIGLATAFGFTLDVMVNRQNDLLVGGCVVAGCWLMTRGKVAWGAIAIGLAAATKCTPLLFVPYLAWVGKWRAALGVLAVALLANLTVDIVYPPSGKPRLVEWGERFLLPQVQTKPGNWHADIGYNHSLAGIVNRLTRYQLVWDGNDWKRLERESQPSAWLLRGLVYGTALILMVATALAIRVGPASRAGQNSGCDEVGFSIVLCLMVLLSPMSSKPHFCVLMVPAWVLARAAIERRDRFLILLSCLAAVLGLSANKDLLGYTIYGWALWHGNIPLAVLLLLTGLMCSTGRKPSK